VLQLWHWSFVVVCLLGTTQILLVQGERSAPLSIAFTEAPPPITSRTNATFRFHIVGANGNDPCGQLQCAIQCKVIRTSFH